MSTVSILNIRYSDSVIFIKNSTLFLRAYPLALRYF